MTDAQQREAARQFFYRWNGKGKEDEDARSYWIEFLQDVMGVSDVTKRVEFEKKLVGSKGSTERIDVYIPETRVIIEQKSLGIPLDKPQAGHDGKTPYQQAKGYDNYLPYEQRARWIVLSNFAEIWIYDLNQYKPEPVRIALADLQGKYHLLDFLVNKETKKITEEVELSKAAGELVGKIRDRFLTQYNDPLAKRTQKSLNVLCVRLVFCFYAEDAGLFGAKDAFSRYILQYKPGDIRGKLIELFKALDTPVKERADMYLPEEVEAFPYVNGGLFSDENIVIPKITQELKDTLAEAAKFDWSKISPTIFGAVFESTLNPETRRAGGMHYTSIENIHKVIDPLFLDDLRKELDEIKKIPVPGTQKKKLKDYQKKLANLVFFDPACGSGNFLTETYLSLRRIENEVLRLIVAADSKTMTGQITFGFEENSPILVNIHQFYGIEINDFAVSVAQTALWIAESQTMKETENIVHQSLDFFPLKTYKGITEGNALRIDWAKVVPVERLSYIIGNPPFVGFGLATQRQKDDLDEVLQKDIKHSKLDYVIGWYVKAVRLIQNTNIKCAFVSTNSVTQGEHVAIFWSYIYSNYSFDICFAHRTFVWNSEANDRANVHCVIIGFESKNSGKTKLLFEGDSIIEADRITPYLTVGEPIIVKKQLSPICKVPELQSGSQPSDGGNLILSEEERAQLIAIDPAAEKYIKPFMMGVDFLNNIRRYCIWAPDITPAELKSHKEICNRVRKVAEFREKSTNRSIREKANIPYRFDQFRPPTEHYLAFAQVSTSRRRYLVVGYLDSSTIPGNKIYTIPNGDLYMMGVLSSNVHMAWIRTVAGRLKSDYNYASRIVYNPFPWPSPTPEQKEKIEKTAQGILDARALYPDSSLADLYDPLTMPPELRKAHTANDKAVMQAYGMPIKETDEAACVAWLMRLYQEMTS